jgi:uncharacterized membrane protein (GlpM family)
MFAAAKGATDSSMAPFLFVMWSVLPLYFIFIDSIYFKIHFI